ncbi:MAG: septation regulator SpoVG [Clostridia bacterium]|nr:septation regulator SpoVG [Clostridia bacterium]
MKITDVRIRLKDEEKLKGIASITIDECFVVHDVKVINGKDGLFISMPCKKSAEGEHRDIAHPIKTETREEIKTAVLDAYNRAVETKSEE